jgi:hypothetical protein
MSRIISAQISGNLEEDYEEVEREVEEDEAVTVSNSEVLRNIIRDGIDSRENPYQLLDLPNEVAAHVEDDREDGESRYAPIKRAIQDGIESRRGDTLDTIGGDEDLRDMVDRVREDGEDLDEAIRRLVRDGVDSNTEESARERLEVCFAVFVLMLVPTLVVVAEGVVASVGYALIVAGMVFFEPQINRVWERSKEILSPLLDRITSAPRILGGDNR